MARIITQRTLRNDSGEIMRQLERGESFIITRNGDPVGELTPLRRPYMATLNAVLRSFADAPDLDLESLRRDLDALSDQTVEPRG